MNRQRLQELLAVHRDGLLNDTVPFWMQHAIDKECGGFLNCLDRDGSPVSTDKSVWVQGRFTWLTALLYNEVEPRQEWLDASRHGIDFMEAHCFDTDGRMFFEVARDGAPLRKRRYLFTETFGVIAFAEYARAAGDAQRLERAQELYRLLIRYYRDPSLTESKFLPGAPPAKAHAMPMILLATTQQLRKHGDDPLYQEIIDDSLQEVFEDFLHEEERALFETVGLNGERLDSPAGRCINPGHAIETSWFILEEARKRGRPELTGKACDILLWSLERGWDKQYGGIFYFVDVEGRPCLQYEHDMKLWWPHTEAMYATLLAWHMTGRQEFADWHERVHEWALAHFPDPEDGVWFKYLHRDGSLSVTLKGSAWAGPFHTPRAQLYCWKLLEEILAENP